MDWKKIKNRIEEVIGSNNERPAGDIKDANLTSQLTRNIDMVNDIIGRSDDVIIRRFKLGKQLDIKACLIFIDGLIDGKIINDNILKPLLNNKMETEEIKDISEDDLMNYVDENIMTINEVKITGKLQKLIKASLDGDTILLIDGFARGLILGSKGWEKRAVSEPVTESVIRGPRDGFTETIRVNTALLRRRVKHPALRIKNIIVGNISQTAVSVCYIEGIANIHLVEEVIERIKNISIDNVNESGYIEQLIEDSHFSPFPQILSTERPDKVAANLFEGRIGIITDGTPFVLVVPITFTILIQSPEDYYERFLIGNFVRLLRLVGAIIALTLPSIYIALIAFHPEMVPTQLALAFAGGRGRVPFPSYVEAFLMEGIMELLREASVRLPNAIGSTIGIVGALIIGDAAVSASIVSPFMVIIVATTTIASFVIPDYSSAIALRLLKFPLMIITTFFGLYGLMLGIIFISIHLASLKSFGIPYLTPLVPSRLSDMKDTLLRFPFWLIFKRPQEMRTEDEQRFSSKGDDDNNERTR